LKVGDRSTNGAIGECSWCQRVVAPSEGEVSRRPLRLLCGPCSNLTDPDLTMEESRDRKSKSGHKLSDFQVVDATRMAKSKRMLLGSQMGVGKTVITIVGGFRQDMPNLLFVPRSMILTWVEEFGEWRPELHIKVASSKAGWKGLFRSLKVGEVLISSFGMLPGEICGGCKSRGSSACAHVSKDLAHPKFIDGIKGTIVPYHLPLLPKERRTKDVKRESYPDGWDDTMKEPCGGCWQPNPLPEVERPMVVVCDEVHAMKSRTALRTRLWRQVVRRVEAASGRVYGLTGTPMENQPGEYFEVLKSLGVEWIAFGHWGNFHRIFRDWLDNEKGARRPPGGQDLQEALVRLRRVRVNRRTKDVLKDLPPRIEQTIKVEISKARLPKINDAVQRLFATRRAYHDVLAGKLDDPLARNLSPSERERRKQIYEAEISRYFIAKPWDHDKEIVAAVHDVLSPGYRNPGIDKLSIVRRLLSMAKIEAVEEWVRNCEEQDEPVVLFCRHLDIVKRIGERPGWEAFHGEMTTRAQHDVIKRFQSGEIRHGITCSIGAAREGITLTRARVVGFVDLDWNPARNRQCEARLIRIGSEKHGSILVVRFVSNHPVDDLVMRTLREKEALLDALDQSDDGAPDHWDEEEAEAA